MAESKDEESDDGLSGAADFVQIYMISVDLIGAHDLIKADVMGKSDPYVKVSAFSTSYTTATIMRNLNPVWNEHVEFTFFNDPKKLKFEVWDWDRNSKDDPIGDCEFAINEDFYLETNDGFHGRLKLQNVKKGELEIKVVARKLIPSALEEKVTSLQDETESNTEKIQALGTQIADINQKNTVLLGEIGALNVNISDLESKIPPKKEELQKLKEEGDTLDTEQKEVESEIEPLQETLSEVEEELKAIIKEVEDVRVKEDKINNEIERIKEQIEDEKKRKEAEEKAAAEQKEKDVETPLVSDPDTAGTKRASDAQDTKCQCCLVQ